MAYTVYSSLSPRGVRRCRSGLGVRYEDAFFGSRAFRGLSTFNVLDDNQSFDDTMTSSTGLGSVNSASFSWFWCLSSIFGLRRFRRRLANRTAPPLDAEDESLQKYKASLGLGNGNDLSDPNDPRVCIILSLTMASAGRPPVTIDLQVPGSENTLKDKPFQIKEGCRFTMSAQFKVQHEILNGLHYVQIVKRRGIRVSKDSEMIVRLS
jgi:hypothetical protein